MRATWGLSPVPILLSVCVACARNQQPATSDDRLVVFGPSLVSLMAAGGMADRIVGADRYSLEAYPWLRAADVGGYLDPALEIVAALEPTSIHSAGRSRKLADLASALGLGYHCYSFDRLSDVYETMDSLSMTYGGSFDPLRSTLAATIDSIRLAVEDSPSIALVVFHEPGGGNLTLAGRDTFLGDLVTEMGMLVCAPGAGTYPAVSVEGMIQMSPDFIFCAYPGRASDSAAVTMAEKEFWLSVGFDSACVDCGFGLELLVPGAGMASTARRIASCTLSI
jgi:ABC-type hemin transport system substrate-binding protein